MGAHGGNLQKARVKYGSSQFIDFSANINPLGPPPGVFKAIEENIREIVHYPEPSGLELRQGLSKHLNIPLEYLVLGNGAAELIFLLARALAPGHAVLPAPTFSEYGAALEAMGARVNHCYLPSGQNFLLDPDWINWTRCDVLFICNPNNPTGTLLPEETFQALLIKARQHKVWIVVDESFMDFVSPEIQWRAQKYLNSYDRLVVIYSLTKFYAIPGLRLGCLMASPELIARMDLLRTPWNVNSLALAAGVAALKDKEFACQTRSLISHEREYLTEKLNRISGLKVFPGAANFLLVKNTGKFTGESLVESLGFKGILIRDCTNFPGLDSSYFRIAVKDRPSNDKLLLALQEVLVD